MRDDEMPCDPKQLAPGVSVLDLVYREGETAWVHAARQAGHRAADGLAMLVQGVLRQDPFSGHLFVFRGRKANLLKIVFWDGTGVCLFAKRLERLEQKFNNKINKQGTHPR